MTKTTQKQDELNTFLQTQFEELLEMSDEEILEGSDSEVLKSEGVAILTSAKAKVGAKRMADAKAAMVAKKVSATPIDRHVNINVDEARAYLQAAANDSQITIAARSLGEMSDEDVMRVYNQLYKLQQDSKDA